MFYFVKWLQIFRIVTEPCADRFLLFGGFSIGLHHALDVGCFIIAENRFVPLRGEMD